MSPRALVPSALVLALLGLSTAAQAQSSVSIYGLVDLSIGRFQAPGGAADKAVESGKMTTSFIGFKGAEDLGGGLKAVFAMESFLRPDTGEAARFNGDAFWARSAYVGLSSGAGTVTLGRNTTSLFVNTLIFNALGDSFGFSPAIRHMFTSGTTTGDTGWSDSVKYASPSFGGLSFTLHAAAAEGADNGRNTGASALYFGGPFSAGAAWQKVKKGGGVADTTAWQLGAAYDFKLVKLFGQYSHVDNDSTAVHYKISGLGASIPAFGGKFLAQIGKVSPDVGAKRTTTTIGYDYDLSKRTDLYAVTMSDKLSGSSTGQNFAVGMRHRF